MNMDEKCNVCNKIFSGMSVNIHGSFEYIRHTNFSNNISVFLNRGGKKELLENILYEDSDCEEKSDIDFMIEKLNCCKYHPKVTKEIYEYLEMMVRKKAKLNTNINEVNEFNTFLQPEKPFLLLSKDEQGHDVVTWHETEGDLMWCVKNNKSAEPYYAMEIGSSRSIKLDGSGFNNG